MRPASTGTATDRRPGLEAGVDVLYIAEVLGHSSPAITQSIYQHSRPERKAQAVERIGAEIFGG